MILHALIYFRSGVSSTCSLICNRTPVKLTLCTSIHSTKHFTMWGNVTEDHRQRQNIMRPFSETVSLMDWWPFRSTDMGLSTTGTHQATLQWPPQSMKRNYPTDIIKISVNYLHAFSSILSRWYQPILKSTQ